MNCNDESTKLNDQSKYKKYDVNDTFRKFPENVLNNANGQFPFLLNSSHVHSFNHDHSVSFLTYSNMQLFDSNNTWLNNRIVMYFLRCIILQSSKIVVLDLLVFNDYQLQDENKQFLG